MSMNAKIILAADLHLQEKTYTALDLHGDSQYSFTQIIDYAIAHQVPTIGLLGDTINVQRPSSSIIDVLLSNLRRAHEAGIQVYVIMGQHDLCRPSWCVLQGYAIHADKKIIRIGKHRFFFLDYQPRAELQETLGDIPPEADILCCHQSVREVLDFGGDDIDKRSWDFELCELPEHVKFTFLGDVHEATHLLTCPSGAQGMYCGSGYQVRWTEPPDKSFLVVDASDDTLKIERIPLLTRPFKHVLISCENKLNEFEQSLEETLQSAYEAATLIEEPSVKIPLVVVEYYSDIDRVYERITKKCSEINEKYPFFFKPVSRVRRLKASDVELSYSLDSFDASPTAGLQLIVDPDEKPELFSFCKELLESDPDVLKTVIEKQRAKYGISNNGQ